MIFDAVQKVARAPRPCAKTGDNGRGRPFYVRYRQILEKSCLRLQLTSRKAVVNLVADFG
jgi:hypothetical protein